MDINAPNNNMLIDVCESRLTVHISVHNLRNMDAPVIGRSDPFALLFLDNTGTSARHIPRMNLDDSRATPETTTAATLATTTAPMSLSGAGAGATGGGTTTATATATATNALNLLNRTSGAYRGRDTRWQRIGVTETVRNAPNAVFATSFEIPYFFERAQRIAVEVFDRDVHDARDDQLHLHDYLGYAEMSVPSVVRAKGQRVTMPLRIDARPNLDLGSITVAVEEVFERKQRIHYSIMLDSIPRRHADGPYLTISRRLAGAANATTTTINSSTLQTNQQQQKHQYSNEMNGIHANNHYNKNAPPRLGKKVRKRTNPRRVVDDSWSPVYRSPRSATPHGRRFVIHDMSHNYEKLCRCDDDMPLRFDVSYHRMGKHHVVASGTTTLAMVQSSNGVIQLSSTTGNSDDDHVGRSSIGCCFGAGSTPPTLTLSNRRITEDTTFLDYIIGGCEISLVVAIDFTASNGDPSQRGSLHFVDSMEPNEYETAIRAVGDILASYDTDQLFPVLGFGAKLPPNYSHPSHCFSITEGSIHEGSRHISDSHMPLSSSSSYQQQQQHQDSCYYIDGVLNAYRHALYNVRLSGPTVFSEIVQAAADHARTEARNNDQAYTILLIITDGVINDVDQTLEALYQASSLPISVVIIGVGDADFSDMVVLDGDDTGRERDIVQFVNFRQYAHAPEVLRSRVLEEIPGQFLQYMKQRNITPLPLPEEGGVNESQMENGGDEGVITQNIRNEDNRI